MKAPSEEIYDESTQGI